MFPHYTKYCCMNPNFFQCARLWKIIHQENLYLLTNFGWSLLVCTLYFLRKLKNKHAERTPYSLDYVIVVYVFVRLPLLNK